MTEALKEFAEKELWLKDRLPDGATREEHLENVWRQTGKMPAELTPVELPLEALYLWRYFLSLGERRSGNGYAANPITNAEVLAWQQRQGIRLEPFEEDVLDVLEQVYLSHHAPKEEAKT